MSDPTTTDPQPDLTTMKGQVETVEGNALAGTYGRFASADIMFVIGWFRTQLAEQATQLREAQDDAAEGWRLATLHEQRKLESDAAADRAEAERDALREALRTAQHYLRDDKTHLRDHGVPCAHVEAGAACGVDLCTLCIVEAAIDAALQPTPSQADTRVPATPNTTEGQRLRGTIHEYPPQADTEDVTTSGTRYEPAIGAFVVTDAPSETTQVQQ